MVAGGSPITVDQLPLLLSSPTVYFTPPLNAHVSGMFAFRVRDDDGVGEAPGHTSDPATVTVNVTAVNDPPSLSGATAAVSEFAPIGLAVTAIAFDDPDLADVIPDTHALALIGGNDDGAFGITDAGIIFVVDPTKLDYEQATHRSLVVEVTDGAGAKDTASIDVTITDETEAQIESVTINGKDADDDGDETNNQKSSIDHLVVRFNSVVEFNFSSGGPFRLIHQESGTEVLTTAALSQVDGKTIVTLRFAPGDSVDELGRLSD
ncbi:MAG TPA: cadherin repeat domain-containing protein, partial [Woeseiaceae bacterium]|nr:cadherin repeat domain-containing protein [Woeseiaceae bacterium]